MNCISLNQAKPPPPPPHPCLSFFASFAQDANDVVTLPSTVVAAFLGHRKKFLDPSSSSFSFLSKPENNLKKKKHHKIKHKSKSIEETK